MFQIHIIRPWSLWYMYYGPVQVPFDRVGSTMQPRPPVVYVSRSCRSGPDMTQILTSFFTQMAYGFITMAELRSTENARCTIMLH